MGWLPVVGFSVISLPAPAAHVWEGDGSLSSVGTKASQARLLLSGSISLTSSLTTLVILGLREEYQVSGTKDFPVLAAVVLGSLLPLLSELPPYLLAGQGVSAPVRKRGLALTALTCSPPAPSQVMLDLPDAEQDRRVNPEENGPPWAVFCSHSES